MFESYYDNRTKQARPIHELVRHFEEEGTLDMDVAQTEPLVFSARDWRSMNEKEQQQTLMNYRIAYLGETMVNWCQDLGTVLANDEVVDGVSVRGGYPVVQRKMRQWCLRVSAYAQRMLDGLDLVDWSDSIKETQRNWVGRSEGAEMRFESITPEGTEERRGHFTIFTTRADTIFGVTFMVLAPESELVAQLTTSEQREEVEAYLAYVAKRTERDRMADHKVTGVFSGTYGVNPFTGERIPIWISEYVLAGYGTGAIMAVPAHDSRDYAFARHFQLPIVPLIERADVSQESFDAKEGTVMNSPREGVNSTLTLNGLTVQEAIAKTKAFIAEQGIGQVKVNYRLRDAIFSRQRYWGEPFPVYYKDDMPYMIPEDCLPLQLPEIDAYKPTESGEPPLGRAEKWAWDTEKRCVVEKRLIDHKTVFPIELCTMPGFAGSSAYYLRYMDPHNDQALVGKKADEYWQNVDLYVGGTEHATGHLIYSRFWNKFLFDLGVSCKEEPFQRLVNQGMIQGRSNFVYRVNAADAAEHPVFVSKGLKDQYDTTPIHVDVNIVHADILDLDAFRAWRPELKNAEFVLEDGKYVCGWAIEKMSKSMFNVVNPDDIVSQYGADTLRLYEMFLGPVEASKPWDTNGIDGCHRFLKKFWKLFQQDLVDEDPTKEELKEPPQAHQEGEHGHRGLLLQHERKRIYGLHQRADAAEVSQPPHPPYPGDGPRTLRSTHCRGALGADWRQGKRLRHRVANLERRLPRRGRSADARLLQRQGALPDQPARHGQQGGHHRGGHERRAKPEVPGGQAGRQDHRRTGTHHQYRGKIDRPKTISITGGRELKTSSDPSSQTQDYLNRFYLSNSISL